MKNGNVVLLSLFVLVVAQLVNAATFNIVSNPTLSPSSVNPMVGANLTFVVSGARPPYYETVVWSAPASLGLGSGATLSTKLIGSNTIRVRVLATPKNTISITVGTNTYVVNALSTYPYYYGTWQFEVNVADATGGNVVSSGFMPLVIAPRFNLTAPTASNAKMSTTQNSVISVQVVPGTVLVANAPQNIHIDWYMLAPGSQSYSLISGAGVTMTYAQALNTIIKYTFGANTPTQQGIYSFQAQASAGGSGLYNPDPVTSGSVQVNVSNVVTKTITVKVAQNYQTIFQYAHIPIAASVSGGTPPYKYQWYNLTGGTSVPVLGENTLGFGQDANVVGIFTYALTVTDSLGLTGTSSNSVVNVNALVPIYGPQLSYMSGVELQNIVFCQPNNTMQMMDIYFPNISADSGPIPLIVYVHGGGWNAGDRNHGDHRQDVSPFVANGFAVATIDYRLSPTYLFPAPIVDTKCAVRFLRTFANSINVDPNRIGADGDSSGGQIVALLDDANVSAGWDVGEWMNQSSAVNAVVSMCGPDNLTAGYILSNGIVRDSIVNEFGTWGANGYNYSVASAVNYVNAGAAPLLIQQGMLDNTVPVIEATQMYNDLAATGATVNITYVQNAGHEFSQQPGPPISPNQTVLQNQRVAWFLKYLG